MSKTETVTATFESAGAIYKAAKKVKEAGFQKWDVHTPFPIHGMDEAMGIKRSKVPRFTLVGGVTGFCTGMLMVWFMGAYDYALIVGGKPYFSPVFTAPIAYELTILFAAFGTLAGMFLTNCLPRPHHRIMDHPKWSRATDDAFILAIDSDDPKFEKDETKSFLKELGGDDICFIGA